MDAPDPEKCRAYQGSGFCARCKGNGTYALGGMPILVRCHDCTGSSICPECDGTGRITDTPKPPHNTGSATRFPLVKLDADACFACQGTGFCPSCGGDGHYIPRGMQAIVTCDRCNGSGACPTCDGTGRVRPEPEDDE